LKKKLVMLNLRKKQLKNLLDSIMICTEDWTNNAEVNLYLEKLLEEIAPEYLYFLKNRVVPETKKFRIVYCCKMEYFIKKMSRVRFWAIIELAKHPNVAMFFIGKAGQILFKARVLRDKLIFFSPIF
jgi:hypothetical protein